jgi:WD40 repeat protein
MKKPNTKYPYLSFIFTILFGIVYVQTAEITGPVRAVNAALISEASAQALPGKGVSMAVSSPDGNILVIAGTDGQIYLWNLVSAGQTPVTLSSQSAGPVSALAVTPDGKTLASVSEGSLRLWDAESGKARLTLPQNVPINALAFSPDGKRLAAVDEEARVTLMDPLAGTVTQQISTGQSDVKAITFSPDSTLLATGGQDAQTKLWTVAEGKEEASLAGEAPVAALAFSPDGKRLAAVDEEARVTLMDPLAGTVTQQIPTGQSAVKAIAFSPDSTLLATGGQDAQAKLWTVAEGKEEASLAGKAPVTALAFSPDGKRLAAGGESEQVFLWDITNKQPQLLTGHKDSVVKVVFSSDRNTLASLDNSGQVIIWDQSTGESQLAFQGIPSDTVAANLQDASDGAVQNLSATATGAAGAATGNTPTPPGIPVSQNARNINSRNWKGITALAVSPDRTLVGGGTQNGQIKLWAVDGTELFTVPGHHGTPVTGVVFSADGKRLISGGRDAEIQTWDAASGKQEQSLWAHEHPVRAVAASPDGKYYASAGEETRIMLWDANARKLKNIFSGHRDFVNAVCFSADGTRLASAGADGRILWWNVESGELVHTLLGHAGAVNAVACSPDGKFVASGSIDSSVILWDSASGKEIQRFAGHQAAVRAVAFSPNGNELVSADEGARVLVWNVATQRLVNQFPGSIQPINALAYGPLGSLIAGDEGGEVAEWNIETGQKNRSLTVTLPPQTGNSNGNSSVLNRSTAPSAAAENQILQSTAMQPDIVTRLLDWLIPSAEAALPDPQGPGGPILVVTSICLPCGTFDKYYAEILRTEGLNEFTVADIDSVTASMLNNYDVVILGQMPLSSGQVTLFTNWVNAGGNLIAMKPDKQLAGLLGLQDAGSTLSNGYLLVNTATAPGNGIGVSGQPMQFHGAADRYTLNGASNIATLYSSFSTATSSPAVTLRSGIGAGGGRAAAFTYDLATSIVYTRQGNPAWATQERDGLSPIRPDDKFFGNSEPDWVDLLNEVAVPQADEQQRLLANLILNMNLAKKPLPRFWYFPRGEKAVVIMTGDDHGFGYYGGNGGGTAGRFEQFKSLSPTNCSVADWECVRGTSYLFPETTTLTDAQAVSYTSQGFEVGLHINTNCLNFDAGGLESIYNQQIANFASRFPSLGANSLSTERHHCLVWSDWVSGAKTQMNHGIRLDTSYYFWPPVWVNNRPGSFTGSAMPMRYADLNGDLIDVYNAVSQMTDESGQTYPFTIDTLLDRAIGSQGYYGAYTINAHTDLPETTEATSTVTSAIARSVPLVSGRQMLNWLDARNGSSFKSLAWNNNSLSFEVVPGTGANGLQAMLPINSAAGVLLGISGPNGAVTPTTQTIKGIQYAFFTAAGGNYTATYGSGPTEPQPCTSASCSAWSSSTTPGTPSVNDPSSVELGVKFRSDLDGSITGIRFYQANTGTYAATLWSSTGQQLATASVTATTGGWQQANFSAPVAITANTIYVASYHAPNGNYAADNSYFANTGVDTPPLHLLQDGVSGGNGVYVYSAGTSFPTNTFQSSNYWVDIAFTTSSGTGTDTTPPTVTTRTPAAGAAGVAANTTVTATFSEAMDPASITSATFQLQAGSNPPVAATVSYAGNTATLTPSSALATSTTYTATVKGGSSGVKDLAGNALAADAAWSFTTGTGDSTACSGPTSIWSANPTPSVIADPETSSVELGVKFRSDTNGFICGIRFYKGSGNTGTHTGKLWSSTGQLLASATFQNETASGWQQVNFASPIAITANTVYVASYLAPAGRYSVDENYFTAAVTSGPLSALSNAEAGGNGVYQYGSGGFPTNSYQASNYWVDVLFSTSTGPDTMPPTVASTSPAADATGVNPTAAVTATFSEAMDPASITATTFLLQAGSNPPVAATVSYTGNTATLTPSSALATSTTYTATVKGGSSGVKDLAGNALATDRTWTFTSGVDACSTGGNPIECENAKVGNPKSEWDISGAGDASIQGFATDISINRGETVNFKIATPSTDYRLDIYRMGFYGGSGARLVATVQPTASLPQNQPNCLTNAGTGLIDCGNWGVSASWPVPTSATSGIYFAKAVREDGSNAGRASHIVFVVRDDGSTSDILFQTSDTTWQAYNSYGGNSFYTGSPAGRAYKVSYNRPFNTRSVDNGQDWLFNAEYPMVRWLEANGYNVSYFTGVDSDRRGNLINNHKVFLSVGHDEYWSGTQRTNVENARGAGVHLAFFSGNEVFWKTRWENSIDGSGTSHRTLVCYKETHANSKIDPTSTWTGTWRDPRFSPPADGGRPENALTGTLFMVNAPSSASDAIRVPEADGKMRFWRNTSVATLASGAVATLAASTLGYEWDEALDNGFRPDGLIHLSSATYNGVDLLQDYGSTYASGTATHHLTLYKDSSGALVFGAGTVQWTWGLDSNHDRGSAPADGRMQQATVNLFADMGVQPNTLQPGLAAATASTDATAPASAVSSPTAGASVQPGSLVTISGTASDIGGRVGGVEVSVDGGATWRAASGRGSWSYSWTAPSTSVTVSIKSRAVDDTGNLELPGAGVTVNVGSGSGSDTAPPTAPGNLSASATSSTQINLTWTASTDNVAVTGYRVERCQGAGCSNFVQIAAPTAASYTDTGLTAETNYRYRVRATDAAGNLSEYSAVASATTTAGTSNNTGFLNPTANTPVTSGAGDNNGFQTNPANAYASDGLFAVDTNSGTGTGTSCTGSGKDKHLYYNYGFNLPGGASVTGIEVRLNARADATSGNPRMCVQISWDGGSTWTAAKTTPTLTTSAATYTLGNSADTWGRAWTADNLSNANFRVRIINVASNTNRDFSLDWAGVQLTYQ